MSLSSITNDPRPQAQQDALASQLQAKGVKADKAESISSKLESVVQSTMTASNGPTDPSTIRATLDQKLAADVESGTLTADEASQVGAALDAFEAKLAPNRPSGGPPPGGGGGGQVEETSDEDDSEKTVLELLMESLKEASQEAGSNKTQDYMTQLMSQGLIDIKA
ncbi:MAG: hypothetical protein VR70_14730 [Rhodospirillaceae bacterium BRH_c57]|nr:MAG: hypothetical protein VR70_14730 [Rhodospirillaceae bacterium BRH_c57]